MTLSVCSFEMSYSKEEFLVSCVSAPGETISGLLRVSEWRNRRKTSPNRSGHANTGDVIMMPVFFSWKKSLSQGGRNYERLQTPVNSG